MNFIIHPLLADGGEGYLAAAAQIELVKAYLAAGISLALALVPWWRNRTRWLSLAFASASFYLVLDAWLGNDPLPWSLAVLLGPLVIALTGVVLSWKLSRRRMKGIDHRPPR